MNALYPHVMNAFVIGEAEFCLALLMRMYLGPFWIIPSGLLGLNQSDVPIASEDE